ncbi:hypothetical protein Tco_0088729 [Tanacetum coccineum]
MLFRITTALNDVNAAQLKLVLLVNFNEIYSKCLRLLEEVTTARRKLSDEVSNYGVREDNLLLFAVEENYPVNDQDDADMFDVNTLTGDEVLQNQKLLLKIASTKVSAATTTTATIPTPRKGILITELEEPVKPLKKKVQIMLDEKATLKLQAEFDEEERLAREKDEANIALTEEWDDIQAKIKADHELAQR